MIVLHGQEKKMRLEAMSTFGGYEQLPFIAEYYDYAPVAASRPDLDFYLGFARAAGGTILEIGCGTGRVLIPIAAAGCRIVGLDLSEHMLARCWQKLGSQAREVQQRVRLVQGNMVGFDLGETFRLIIIPFRPFQHLLSVEEQLACLRCVQRHLAAGGTLILDVFHTDVRRMYDPVFSQESQVHREVTLPDGRKLRFADRIVGFHRAEQFNDVELIYYVTHPDGRTERLVQAFPVRYFFRYEVEHLLARSGFSVTKLLGDFDQSRLVDDSPEMIFVAEKRPAQ
jgi:SAM-dependent methyltransferase